MFHGEDLDFELFQITVRSAKGEKDRPTLLPALSIEGLNDHLARVPQQHEPAKCEGYGGANCCTRFSESIHRPITSGVDPTNHGEARSL